MYFIKCGLSWNNKDKTMVHEIFFFQTQYETTNGCNTFWPKFIFNIVGNNYLYIIYNHYLVLCDGKKNNFIFRDGKYPFPALSHRSHGGTDMKLTSHR